MKERIEEAICILVTVIGCIVQPVLLIIAINYLDWIGAFLYIFGALSFIFVWIFLDERKRKKGKNQCP